MHVVDAVDRFLRRLDFSPPADRMLVAFSGGPDSTALLHALTEIAGAHALRLHAAHLDHGIDRESAHRSRRASDLARSLRVPLILERRSALDARGSGESLEAAARRIRYDFLEECAARLGAAWIATAHHADDQRETVLLRMMFGSGIAGLAGIPARRGAIVRPLLEVDRSDIEEYLRRQRLEPVDDPTNYRLDLPRNVIRHRLLPALRAEDPAIDRRLPGLARAARSAVRSLDRRLLHHLLTEEADNTIALDRELFTELRTALRQHAIGAACRQLDAPPPSLGCLAEIDRQLSVGSGVGCDLGSGWRIEDAPGVLVLARARPGGAPFAYTLKVPGELRLPELSLVFRLTRRPTAPWMFRGSRRRAGMSLPLSDGDTVTIRSRRPGDRMRPLGCEYSRRLKEILIDRKIPQEERDRLPLLCLGESIVWIPGVTIDESVKLRQAREAWVAEIEEVEESGT